MKRILTLLLLSISFSAFAQQHANSDVVLKQLVELFNQDKFSDLYNQLTPEFKQQQKEASIVSFYQNRLKNALGKITDWKYQRSDAIFNYYLITFEHGLQNLKLSATPNQLIAGMTWSSPKAWKDVATIKSNNPKQTKLQSYVDSLALDFLRDPENNSLSIGLVDGDKTEMFFYGETTKGTGLLPNEQSVYEIGSISKTFTSIMLAHAINEGKIALIDDIRKYLPGNYPDLQFNGKPITVLNLANHTSTLPRLPANMGTQPGFKNEDPYKGYDKAMIYQYLSTFKPDSVIGTKSAYSNFGVAVLGTILENVYQVPLEKLLQQVITGPLKMDGTAYLSLPEQEKLKTTGYSISKAVPYWDMADFKAAGGIKSNLKDMMIYLKANMKETNKDISLSHKQTFSMPAYNIGLGWLIKPVENNTMIFHDGATAGFTSFITFTADHKKGVIILNNSTNAMNAMGQKLLSFLL